MRPGSGVKITPGADKDRMIPNYMGRVEPAMVEAFLGLVYKDTVFSVWFKNSVRQSRLLG